jgi:membrane-associated protease RseP (regulator of RpoE activity)
MSLIDETHTPSADGAKPSSLWPDPTGSVASPLAVAATERGGNTAAVSEAVTEQVVEPAGQSAASAAPTGTRQLTNIVLILAALAVPVLFFDAAMAVMVIGCLLATIMLHEAGHFLVAKAVGMKATEFFLGFGPRLVSFRRGETEYGLKAFPLGGYVKVIGMSSAEEVDPAEEHRTYRAKATWKRVAMTAAGPMTHFVAAFVFLTLAYGPVGIPGSALTSVAGIGAGSPAAVAGLQINDKIVAINNVEVSTFESIRSKVLASNGETLQVTIVRNGVEQTLAIAPKFDPASKAFMMGVTPQEGTVSLPLGAAAGESVRELKELTSATFDGLIGFFTPDRLSTYANTVATANQVDELTEEQNNGRVSTPVSTVKYGVQFAEAGLANFLYFLTIFNLGVGVFNLLPLPPFDGGHIVVALYERVMTTIKGRRHFVDANKIVPVALTVMGILMVIFTSALYLDITKP